MDNELVKLIKKVNDMESKITMLEDSSKITQAKIFLIELAFYRGLFTLHKVVSLYGSRITKENLIRIVAKAYQEVLLDEANYLESLGKSHIAQTIRMNLPEMLVKKSRKKLVQSYKAFDEVNRYSTSEFIEKITRELTNNYLFLLFCYETDFAQAFYQYNYGIREDIKNLRGELCKEEKGHSAEVCKLLGDFLKVLSEKIAIDSEGGKGKGKRFNMLGTSFNEVWSRIVAHAGKTFYTKKDLEFTYEIKGEVLSTSRTNYGISKAEFEKAYRMGPLAGPGVITNIVRGPSYIWAILHDKRIAPEEWGSRSYEKP